VVNPNDRPIGMARRHGPVAAWIKGPQIDHKKPFRLCELAGEGARCTGKLPSEVIAPEWIRHKTVGVLADKESASVLQ